MNTETEWFALMNEDGMFFEQEGTEFRFKKFRFQEYTVWGSSPQLRNKKATEIYLKKMQKKHGGRIVRFVKLQEKDKYD